MNKTKIAVLISGNGSNLQAIIDACKDSNYPAEIGLIISNNKDAYGLERAKTSGIAYEVINHKDFSTRESFDKQMDSILTKNKIEFICLAGFMRLLSGYFVNKWKNKLINIHPSLLPAFKGVNAQKQALDYGVKVTGCTVHFVTEDMDAGPIIMQKVIEIYSTDTEKSLTQRLLEQEHKCYVEALSLVLGAKNDL